MELKSVKEIASVMVFDLTLSEGELMVYESCIDFVLRSCSDEQVAVITGCSDKAELAAFRDDLRTVLRQYVLKEYLPDKLKE